MIVQPWIVELPNEDNTKSCFVGVPEVGTPCFLGVLDSGTPCDVVVPLDFLWTLLVKAGYEVTRPGWGVIVFVPPSRVRKDLENQIADLQYRKDKAETEWLAEHTDGPADDSETLASQEVL